MLVFFPDPGDFSPEAPPVEFVVGAAVEFVAAFAEASFFSLGVIKDVIGVSVSICGGFDGFRSKELRRFHNSSRSFSRFFSLKTHVNPERI